MVALRPHLRAPPPPPAAVRDTREMARARMEARARMAAKAPPEAKAPKSLDHAPIRRHRLQHLHRQHLHHPLLRHRHQAETAAAAGRPRHRHRRRHRQHRQHVHPPPSETLVGPTRLAPTAYRHPCRRCSVRG